jgi:hypothetical protein
MSLPERNYTGQLKIQISSDSAKSKIYLGKICVIEYRDDDCLWLEVDTAFSTTIAQKTFKAYLSEAKSFGMESIAPIEVSLYSYRLKKYVSEDLSISKMISGDLLHGIARLKFGNSGHTMRLNAEKEFGLKFFKLCFD